jgi:hypothetical protein
MRRLRLPMPISERAALIRLGYLAVVPRMEFRGRIGSVSSARRKRLLTRLSEFLRPPAEG